MREGTTKEDVSGNERMEGRLDEGNLERMKEEIYLHRKKREVYV